MRCLIGIILLAFLVLGVKGDCPLVRHMVENTNRIFTYRDYSGDYQLLRSEIVPSGVILYMMCNPGDVVETECQDNGRFSQDLPMRCNDPMQPKATPIKDNDCFGQMYAIGYAIEGRLLELYRTCYNAKIGRVVYAQSDVYFKSYFAQRPFVDFLTDQIVTPAEGSAYKKENIYDQFCSIFGQSQSHIPRNGLIINRGHLVASADFLFVDQMSSTFRYLNIVPQFKSINDGNWEKIERWVRSQVPRSVPFRVKTGGINVLTLEDEKGYNRQAYLYSDSRIPVPEWTYKVVRDINGKGLYVFLTFNCTFLKQRPPVIDICQPVPCPFNLPDNPHDGYTFCCDPANFPL